MKTEEMFGGKGTEMWIMNGCVCAGGAVGGGMFCPVCPPHQPRHSQLAVRACSRLSSQPPPPADVTSAPPDPAIPTYLYLPIPIPIYLPSYLPVG